MRLEAARRVFTPHAPIVAPERFRGRTKLLEAVTNAMASPGSHALVWGARGLGKTSLANIVRHRVGTLRGVPTYLATGEKGSTTESLMEQPLDACGASPGLLRQTKKAAEKEHLGVSGIVKAGLESRSETTATYRPAALTPGRIVRPIADQPGVLVVDDADRVENTEVLLELSSICKGLSDRVSPFKLLILGSEKVACCSMRDGDIASRCLLSFEIDRMPDGEIKDILVKGFAELRLTPGNHALARIVRLASGHPYFAHLIALKCAMSAIADGRESIDLPDLPAALDAAVHDCEPGLRATYDLAVSRGGLREQVLLAAACVNRRDFTPDMVRAKAAGVVPVDISPKAVRTALGNLSSQEGGQVLSRTRRGVYHFSDPRLSIYVKMHAYERLHLTAPQIHPARPEGCSILSAIDRRTEESRRLLRDGTPVTPSLLQVATSEREVGKLRRKARHAGNAQAAELLTTALGRLRAAYIALLYDGQVQEARVSFETAESLVEEAKALLHGEFHGRVK
ncbi:MAG: hypothetical protein AB7V19_06550 [Candidatus Bipolaricaulia bacterium]